MLLISLIFYANDMEMIKRTIFVILEIFVLIPLFAKPILLYQDPSQPIDVRVQDLLTRMTLEEKIDQLRHVHAYSILENGKINKERLDELLQGKSMGFIEAITLPGKECLELMNEVQRYMRTKTRLGIPIFTVTESLHGSVHDGSTIFPQAIALGSTFNPSLAYEMASSIAKELKAQGIKQSLTPVIDVCRDLRWGRVEECFGEDPFLVSRMGVSQVRGYLDNSVSPMIKHFGAHASPVGGLNLASVSCGERDLLSVYLKPFETVVKEAGPWAVMSSYNSWNNEPNSSSFYLMTELLRNQWGFQGYVYSDWGAIGMLNYFHKTASNSADAAFQALTAGLDAEASDNCYTELQQLVENRLLDVKYINQAVSRVLRAKFAMGLFEYSLPKNSYYSEFVHTEENITLARKIAEESIILLQNRNDILPLDVKKIKSIAIIGPNADQVQFGDYTWSRNNRDGVTLLAALRQKIGNQIMLNYAKGCDLVTDDCSGFNEAVSAAQKSDVCIVVVGSASASLARDYSNATCGEGFDLNELTLTGVQEKLIKAVHATGKPVIVVLLSGKPFAIPWIKENIPGVIVQWYPGEQGGVALADMILGKVNPSGKLNYSFPRSVGQLPCYYNYLPTDKGFYHSPGSKNKPGKDYVFSTPESLWAFGYGLSYTKFDYISATTSRNDYNKEDTIDINVLVHNSGKCDGQEVVQVYVRDCVSSVVTPIQELKGFKKVFIKRGDTVSVKIRIPIIELSLYDKDMKKKVEPGTFELQIGSASNDIRIKKKVTVEKKLEKVVPTLKDRKLLELDKVQTVPIIVKGTVRDVQANVLSGVLIKVRGKETVTDKKGKYIITAMSTDTLTVKRKNFKSESILIRGRKIIDIKLQNE